MQTASVKKAALFGIIAFGLSACGGSSTPQDRQARAQNTELWQTRQAVSVAGKPFSVAVSADKSYALVAPAGSGYAYSELDVEAAARGASNCKADMAAGVLAFLGGYSDTADLRVIQSKSSNWRFWRADLTY